MTTLPKNFQDAGQDDAFDRNAKAGDTLTTKSAVYRAMVVPISGLRFSQEAVAPEIVARFDERVAKGETIGKGIKIPVALFTPGVGLTLIDGHHRVTAWADHGNDEILAWVGIQVGTLMRPADKAALSRAGLTVDHAFAEIAPLVRDCGCQHQATKVALRREKRERNPMDLWIFRKSFVYALTRRPVAPWTVPKGFQELMPPTASFPFGTVVYERPIKEDQIDAFELEPLDPDDPIVRKRAHAVFLDEIRREVEKTNGSRVTTADGGSVSLSRSTRPNVDWQVTFWTPDWTPTGHLDVNDFEKAVDHLFSHLPKEERQKRLEAAVWRAPGQKREENPVEADDYQMNHRPARREKNPIDRADIEALGRAYIEGVDIAQSPEAQAMAREQAGRVHREFDKLRKKIRIEFTERDPYQSFEELIADIRGNKRMQVYTGSSETPLWDERTNWQARAVHDWDHVQAMVDFSLPGELDAFRVSAARAPALSPLYLSEIALQAASYHVLGGAFAEGPQKLVKASPRIERLATELRGNPVLSPDDVLLAATLLRFMPKEEVMAHLVAKGKTKVDAEIAVEGAIEMQHPKTLLAEARHENPIASAAAAVPKDDARCLPPIADGLYQGIAYRLTSKYDVLIWRDKKRVRVAFQADAKHIEWRYTNPMVKNYHHSVDSAINRAVGVEDGQRISDDEDHFKMVFEGIDSAVTEKLMECLGVEEIDAPVTTVFMPKEGAPLHPYYSARKKAWMPAGKAPPTITVRVRREDPSQNYREVDVDVKGANVCKLLGRVESCAPDILAEGEQPFMVFHGTHPTPEDAEAVKACRGWVFSSLGVGMMPSSGFGPLMLFSSVDLILTSLKPYRNGRARRLVTLYDTDSWTIGSASIPTISDELYQQLTGTYEEDYGSGSRNTGNHQWVLGAPVLVEGGPFGNYDAKVIESTTQLVKMLRARRKVWHDKLTDAGAKAIQESPRGHSYPYAEAKVNGVIDPGCWKLAVVSRGWEASAKAYLKTTGVKAKLLVVDDPPGADASVGRWSSSMFDGLDLITYSRHVGAVAAAYARKHGLVRGYMLPSRKTSP